MTDKILTAKIVNRVHLLTNQQLDEHIAVLERVGVEVTDDSELSLYLRILKREQDFRNSVHYKVI